MTKLQLSTTNFRDWRFVNTNRVVSRFLYSEDVFDGNLIRLFTFRVIVYHCFVYSSCKRWIQNFIYIRDSVTGKVFADFELFSDRFLLFRSRKKFSTTYAIVLFCFSRPFHENFKFLKNCPYDFHKILHSHSTPKGAPACAKASKSYGWDVRNIAKISPKMVKKGPFFDFRKKVLSRLLYRTCGSGCFTVSFDLH